MKLMIVESPGKIKKLSAILGSSWKVVASVGHVRDLPINDIGIDQETFSPNYVLTERGADVVRKLKSEVKSADEVYLATDPDREGEAISWHLEQCLGLKNSKRITFNEIKESTVKKAISEVRKIDYKLVQAQEARRVLDRFVGYLVSPVLSAGLNGKFSAGRVQSPAVMLVVDREREIRDFKITNHFSVKLNFIHEKDEWFSEWQLKPEFVSDEQPYFMDKACAELVAATKRVIVISFNEAEKKRNPPPPFTTSTMQQAASVVLKMSPKDAMAVAQKLYEGGHISYHRTDNPNISPDDMPFIYEVAKSNGWEAVQKQRMFKAPEGAQAGHPAITPTHWEVDTAGDTSNERALYTLIRLRAISSQLVEARYSERVVILEALGVSLEDPYQEKTIRFEGRGRTLLSPGWLRATQEINLDNEDEAEANNPIPILNEGSQLRVESSEVLAKKTRPPARYTEATLVRQLEREGIGRPATYAAIMDNIITREYVAKDKKNFLSATAKGELLVDALIGGFDFMNLSFTKEAEAELDRIAEGKTKYQGVISSFHRTLVEQLGILKSAEHFKQLKTTDVVSVESGYSCPDCGKSMRRIKGAKGYFWGCSGYQEGCKRTLQDDNGKAVTESKPQRDSSEGLIYTCPSCKEGKLTRRSGKSGHFWGCNKYPNCKHTQPDDDGKPGQKSDLTTKQSATHTKPKTQLKASVGDKCPTCKKGKLIGRVFKENGKKYIGCDGYPNCRFFCWT